MAEKALGQIRYEGGRREGLRFADGRVRKVADVRRAAAITGKVEGDEAAEILLPGHIESREIMLGQYRMALSRPVLTDKGPLIGLLQLIPEGISQAMARGQ